MNNNVKPYLNKIINQTKLVRTIAQHVLQSRKGSDRIMYGMAILENLLLFLCCMPYFLQNSPVLICYKIDKKYIFYIQF